MASINLRMLSPNEAWILVASLLFLFFVLSVTRSTTGLPTWSLSLLKKPSDERPRRSVNESTSRQSQPGEKSTRGFVFRVSNIPLGPSDTPASLLGELRSVASFDSKIAEALKSTRKVTLVPSGNKTLCATVHIQNTLPKELAGSFVSKLAELDSNSQREYDSTFTNISPIYENPRFEDEPVNIDIVAVPGLASHPIGSWMNKNGNCWLRDFIPEAFPNTRVLLYGYDSRLLGSESNQGVAHMGQRLLNSLAAFRTDTNTAHRPIIFIGHSLGGLLIKEALHQAHRNHSQDEAVASIAQRCYALLMFGVPNRGLRHRELLAITKNRANQHLLNDIVLREDGEPPTALRDLCQFFSDSCHDRYDIVCFCEKQRTPTTRKRSEDQQLERGDDHVIMVSEDSAFGVGDSNKPMQHQVNLSLNLNHTELVKYPSRSDGDYPLVRGELGKLISAAKARHFDFDSAGDKALFELLKQKLCLPEHDYRERQTGGIMKGPYWLLENQTYKKWRSSVSDSSDEYTGLLTLKGHPGAGKSVLINRLVQDQLTTSTSPEAKRSVTLSHFFYQRDGCAEASTPFSFYLHVFWQLIDRVRHRPWSKMKTWAEALRGDRTPSEVFPTQELRREIESLLVENSGEASSHSSFHLYIDALDECAEPASQDAQLAGMSEVLGFINSLLKLRDSEQVDIRIVVSRRPEPTIGGGEPPGQSILMNQDQHYLEDVNKFAQGELPASIFESSKGDPYFKRRLLAKIQSRSANGFLWVCLVTQYMKNESEALGDDRDEALLSLVETLPPDLKRLYDKILDSVLERWGYKASALLRIILFAERKLEPEAVEAAWAVLTTADKDIDDPRAGTSTVKLAKGKAWVARLQRISGGLLEPRMLPKRPDPINDPLDPQASLREMLERDPVLEGSSKLYVQFVHGTVDEHLRGSQDKLRRGDRHVADRKVDVPVEASSHFVLAKACLWTLSRAYYGAPSAGSAPSSGGRDGIHGFVDYASEFWLYHIARSGALIDEVADPPFFLTHCDPDTADLIEKQYGLLARSQALAGDLIRDNKHILVALASFGCTALLERHLRECTQCKKLSHMAKELKAAREMSITAVHPGTALFMVDCLGKSMRDHGTPEFQAEVNTLLYKACYFNIPALLPPLRNLGADPTACHTVSYGYGYPLLAATALGHQEAVEQLLKQYGDRLGDLLALQRPRTKETVLHIIIRKRNQSPGHRYRMLLCIARPALEKGVQLPLLLCDKWGETPRDLVMKEEEKIKGDMRECPEDELQDLRAKLDEVERIRKYC